MAGKSKSSGKVSLGGRQKNNVAHELKRQEKFRKRREEGKAYKYVKNPYKKGTQEYEHERLERLEKTKSSRCKYARLTSLFAKLDNYLLKQYQTNKEAKERSMSKA